MARMFRNLGAGLLRGATADVLGMPVDTLNMIRQGLLAPAEGGNPMARSLTGLLGPVQQTGSSDYFAQQMGLPQGEGAAYEIARMLSPSPTDIMSAVRRAPTMQELITYHGTPHRFEPTPANPLGEFEASKIGTGEGAQAYGHGVYLAESPEVAGQYKDLLGKNIEVFGKPMYVNNKYVGTGLGTIEDSLLLGAGGDVDEAIKQARVDYQEGDTLRRVLKNLDLAKENVSVKNSGSLYTADLPDEMIDRMLDWNKPLSEQPYVLKALDEAGYDEKFIDMFKEYPAGEIYKSIAGGEGFEDFRPQASDELRKYGIPGIKYLDQGSRDKGKGTRNFVVFPGEEKKIKILKRE